MTKRFLPLTALLLCLGLFLALGGTAYGAGKGQATISKSHKAKRGPKGKPGATGEKGAQGPAGPTGPAGQRGPSTGYQATAPDVDITTSGLHDMAKLSLPAGSYLVSAKLWARDGGSERDYLECKLTNDHTEDSDFSEITLEPQGSTSFGGRGVVFVQAAANLPSGGVWTLSCAAGNSLPMEIHNIKMQAIQVGSLVTSGS